MKKPAVFLDRDGTINEQMGYINHLDRFKLLPRSAAAIALLNRNQFLALVVSNQSGVARGYHSLALVHETHALMQRQLANGGAQVDGIFFCPHHPQGCMAEYSITCQCRKPHAGLIEQACRQFEIDLARSYVVGDSYSDLELAFNAGVKGILVQTGYGLGEMEYILPQKKNKPLFIAQDLYQAVQWILADQKPAR